MKKNPLVCEFLEPRRLLSALPTVVAGATMVNPANGHTYYLLTPSDWPDAEAEAKVLGGNLVTIRSNADQQWVQHHMALTAPIWLGYYDPAESKSFTWVDGEPTTYTHWSNGVPGHNPANQYGMMLNRSSGGMWLDIINIFKTVPVQGVVEVGQAISASAPTVSTYTASGLNEGTTQVSVNLGITYSYDADLSAVLTGPTGASIDLFSNTGANGANFTNTTLADFSSVPIQQAPAPFIGTFSPQQPLSKFIGLNPNGNWTLTLKDRFTGDVGTLNYWSLSFQSPTSDSAGDRYIPNGDGSPRADDGTDFGSTVSPVTHEFEVETDGGATVIGGAGQSPTASAQVPAFPQLFSDVAGEPTINSTITEAGLATSLSEVSVSLSLRNEDATIENATLTSPAGQSITLFSYDTGGSPVFDAFDNTTFTDATTNTLPNTPSSALTGSYQAQGGTFAGTFAGENPNGKWTLNVTEQFQETGPAAEPSLINWSLNVTAPPPTPTVAVTGTNPADFIVATQPTLPLGSQSKAPFDITFKPTGVGERTAVVTVTIPNGTSKPTAYSFGVQGQALAVPLASVTGNDDFGQPSYNFSIGSNNAVSRTFTITNQGFANLALTGKLTIANATFVPMQGLPTNLGKPSNLSGVFSIVSTPSVSSLTPGSETTFSVKFVPTAPGNFYATVEVPTSDPADPLVEFEVTGFGYRAPDTFGDVPAVWPTPYNDEGFVSNGSEVNGASVIDVGGAIDTNVGPQGNTYSGTLGSAMQGSNPLTFQYTISNTSGELETLTTPTISSPFLIVSGPSTLNLSTGSSTSFTIELKTSTVYNPVTSGTCTFRVTGFVATAIPNLFIPNFINVFSLNLTGTVMPTQAAQIAVTSGSAFINDTGSTATEPAVGAPTNFGSVNITSSSSKTFTVTNPGSSTLTLNSITLSGADPGDFSIQQPSSKTVAAGKSVSFTVVFKPQAGGLRTALLSINNSDSAQADYSFDIAGTVTGTVATPTFSVAAGNYLGSETVSLACSTVGSPVIHYTLDGSTPTASSPVYSKSLVIKSTQTVKAIAVESGLTNSAVASATYTIVSQSSVSNLSNGTTVSGLSGSTASQRFFQIVVPSGKKSLSLTISGGSGDAYLYLRRSSLPSTGTYDEKATVSGNKNSITLTNPVAGTYYLLLYGDLAFSGVTLKALLS